MSTSPRRRADTSKPSKQGESETSRSESSVARAMKKTREQSRAEDMGCK